MLLALLLVIAQAVIRLDRWVSGALFVVAAVIGAMITHNWMFVALAYSVRFMLYGVIQRYLKGERWNDYDNWEWALRIILFLGASYLYYE